MEEVRLREIAHITGNMSKHVQSWVDMAHREFGIRWLRVGIAERSILGVITPGVFRVRMHIILKLVLWILPPKTDMSLDMM
jgi:hypothetical protein